MARMFGLMLIMLPFIAMIVAIAGVFPFGAACLVAGLVYLCRLVS